jgi:hypothetical protein
MANDPEVVRRSQKGNTGFYSFLSVVCVNEHKGVHKQIHADQLETFSAPSPSPKP